MSISLIPHAGKKYAGDLRKKVFKKMKRSKKIVFLTADHKNIADKYLHCWNTRPLKWMQKMKRKEEHSFLWVKKELTKYYKTIEVYTLGRRWEEKKDLIINFLNAKHKKGFLIIGTTDLVHHGPNYKFNIWDKYPQAYKQIYEEDLINSLIETNVEGVEKELQSKSKISCGPRVIKCISILAEKNKLHGEVIDYYDSTLSKYHILPRVENFVSYVGIVFSKKKKKKPSLLDINMGLEAIKHAIIYRDIQIPLPKWSWWNKIKQGVFVGTEKNGHTNCSYGRYENGFTTGKNIISAARDCVKDARNRWKNPYNLKNMDDITYKIELLQDKSKWKTKKARRLRLKKQTKYGILLKFKSNGMTMSATYLPNVWKESLKDIQNVSGVLNKLSEKAGAFKNDWKKDENAKVLLYTSKKYKTKKKKMKRLYNGKTRRTLYL